MTIMKRPYKLLGDFQRVLDFLDDNYELETLNGYLLHPFFEYAHTHPIFNHSMTHRFGLWEEAGDLVGIACYEMDLGEACIEAKAGYNHLLPDMLDHAEDHLSASVEGKQVLGVWITDKETDMIHLLKSRGYERARMERITIFNYAKGFLQVDLAQGYDLISLEEENDPSKIHACLYKGFNHQGEPKDEPDSRLIMQSGPNFRPDLTTVARAGNGDYATYAGMWMNQRHGYAYLEPLATVPDHRRKGLAAATLVEAMKKTAKEGATYCFGGVNEFYQNLGFETIAHREYWKKSW